MLPLAHIASTVLATRLTGLDRDPTSGVVGALLPDVIDKTLAWVLGVTPAARHIGHSLLAVAAATAVAHWLVGPRRAGALGLAYLVHLLGDAWVGGYVPWWLPFRPGHARSRRWEIELQPRDVALEALGAALLLYLLRRTRAEGVGAR